MDNVPPRILSRIDRYCRDYPVVLTHTNFRQCVTAGRHKSIDAAVAFCNHWTNRYVVVQIEGNAVYYTT